MEKADLPPLPTTISRRAKARLLKWDDGWDALMTDGDAAAFPEGTLLIHKQPLSGDLQKYRLSAYGVAVRDALKEKANVGNK